MIRSFVVISFMISASVAAAQATGDGVPAPAEKPVKEKKICRDSDDSTSRVAKRICRTAKEWEEARGNNGKAGVRSVRPED